MNRDQKLVEDGLATAYAFFKQEFEAVGLHEAFTLGAGYHPVLSTHKVEKYGITSSALITFALTSQAQITEAHATLSSVDLADHYDLWIVKNDKAGGTVAPEAGDSMVKIGTFTPNGDSKQQDLDVIYGEPWGFDFDMVVVTHEGQDPAQSRVAIGARTLLEKRALRERAGIPMDSSPAIASAIVETTDPLVRRGADLFFNETFGGNGRTCGTCHRNEDNLTIDPALIASLPANDPLFVFRNNPDLADLEDDAFLTSHGLVKVNADGFGDPGEFVLRSTNHTLALGTTNSFAMGARGRYPFSAPTQRLGWGGDGAPGSGTLHEFSLGAIHQHLPQRLSRVAGIDFRLPTQAELDALEAFQLFTGRQRIPKLDSDSQDADFVVFRDATARRGQALAATEAGAGRCVQCHTDLAGNTLNLTFNIGTEGRLVLPHDDGFLQPVDEEAIPQPIPDQHKAGEGAMNPPPLIEAADTAPLFHNHSAQSVEEAIEHYRSDAFGDSPGGRLTGGKVELTGTEADDIANFLREVNAAENIRQVRKRTWYVHDNRDGGNGDILRAAIRDTDDAIRDLEAKGLNLTARNNLAAVKSSLQIALAQPDANRPAYLANALAYLSAAKTELITSDPKSDF